MGAAVARVLDRHDSAESAGHWSRDGDLESLLDGADVVVDFTLPEATNAIIRACVGAGRPLVCGVTGLDETGEQVLHDAARSIPVVYDRNMSVGVAVLTRALANVATGLGAGFDASIAETHHVHKKDAPSGTALKLRDAITGPFDPATIALSSERRGEVPGDHEVIFESATERLCFSHSVTTRDVFAEGAVRAAVWAAGQSPGFYSMQDVLFEG